VAQPSLQHATRQEYGNLPPQRGSEQPTGAPPRETRMHKDPRHPQTRIGSRCTIWRSPKMVVPPPQEPGEARTR
jgi:hypothetical protein